MAAPSGSRSALDQPASFEFVGVTTGFEIALRSDPFTPLEDASSRSLLKVGTMAENELPLVELGAEQTPIVPIQGSELSCFIVKLESQDVKATLLETIYSSPLLLYEFIYN